MNQVRIISIVLVFMLILSCLFFQPGLKVVNANGLSDSKTSDDNLIYEGCKHFSLINIDNQFINGYKINTSAGENILYNGSKKANCYIKDGDKVDISGFRIRNKTDEEIYIGFLSITESYKLDNIFGNPITRPIKIGAGCDSDPLFLSLVIPECNHGKVRILSFYHLDSEGERTPECVRNDIGISYYPDTLCKDCTDCHKDSSWTGISDTPYPSDYPFGDIQVSMDYNNQSRTSKSRKNIAIGGDYIHAVWIESRSNGRNIYYSYADFPLGVGRKWSLPVNITKFNNSTFHALTVSIAADSESVFIVWNMEINHRGDDGLKTESADDHHVYCIRGTPGNLNNWETLNYDGTKSPYVPPKNINTEQKHNANVSRNSSYDSWKPSVTTDHIGRVHITWENELYFKEYSRTLKGRILWVFWDDGWKTVPEMNEDAVPYVFSPDNDNIANITYYINSPGFKSRSYSFHSPSITIRYSRYSKEDIIFIAFETRKNNNICLYEIIYKEGYFIDAVGTLYLYKFGTNLSVGCDRNLKPIIVCENKGNIYEYYTRLMYTEIIDDSGKCSNPMIAVSQGDEYHIVYEREGDIYYSYYVSRDCYDNINLSNNEGYSCSPSITFDRKTCFPHVLWTDTTPNYDMKTDDSGITPEVIYAHLNCQNIHRLIADLFRICTSTLSGVITKIIKQKVTEQIRIFWSDKSPRLPADSD